MANGKPFSICHEANFFSGLLRLDGLALVPGFVRRPLVASQTDGLAPLLVAAWTSPSGIEGVPHVPTAGIAEPGIVFSRRPLALRAPYARTDAADPELFEHARVRLADDERDQWKEEHRQPHD
jgi:hypothetical protein